jgi:hypothetical protein
MARVEWHPGELYPRAGFILTNLAAERVVTLYNQRGIAGQWIKEGWARSSGPGCRAHICGERRPPSAPCPAYNLGNFTRTLAMPKTAEPWLLTSLREKLIKIGAKVVSHGRYVAFQMAEVAVPRQIFHEFLSLVARLRASSARA